MRIGWKFMLVACLMADAIAVHAQCFGGTPTPPAICLGGVLVKEVPPDTKTVAPVALAMQAIINDPPAYPDTALRAQAAGIVREAIRVNKEGHVEKILATDGPETLLPVSTEAIKQWTFKPFLLNGEPIAVASTVYLFFNPAADKSGPRVSVIPGMVRISGGVAAGILKKSVPPSYPIEAKQHHIEGSVIFYAVLGTDGKIWQLKVISGPKELVYAAADAVRQWEYKPYLLNGQVTAVETTITINFNLAG